MMNLTEAFKPRSMISMLGDDALINSHEHATNNMQQPMKLLPIPLVNNANNISLTIKHTRVETILSTMSKLVRGKLSLGAKILQVGGVDKVFRRIFIVRDEEKLLRGSRCCLSTVAGPIPGRLFVSTDKIAFCSDKAIARVSSPSGESLRFHYKIVIPLAKIKETIQSENMKKPWQKYAQVVTKDEFEFWFMEFLHYKKTFRCLQQVLLSQTLNC